LHHLRLKDLEAGRLKTKTLAKIIEKSEGGGRMKRVIMSKKITKISSECKIKK
jgi:hypothetical protein